MSDLQATGFPRISRAKLVDVLSAKYPQHKWDAVYLLRGRYSQQKRLERTVASLFPVTCAKIYSSNLYICIYSGCGDEDECEERCRDSESPYIFFP